MSLRKFNLEIILVNLRNAAPELMLAYAEGFLKNWFLSVLNDQSTETTVSYWREIPNFWSNLSAKALRLWVSLREFINVPSYDGFFLLMVMDCQYSCSYWAVCFPCHYCNHVSIQGLASCSLSGRGGTHRTSPVALWLAFTSTNTDTEINKLWHAEGACSSILILKIAHVLLSSICLDCFYKDSRLINLKHVMSVLAIRDFWFSTKLFLEKL